MRGKVKYLDLLRKSMPLLPDANQCAEKSELCSGARKKIHGQRLALSFLKKQ
ncbi:MAG: hypothetical protein NVS2B12_39210 [Ktedonobacteraceae bacterium]